MKLRILPILALVLVLGATFGWYFFAREGSDRSVAAGANVSGDATTVAESQASSSLPPSVTTAKDPPPQPPLNTLAPTEPALARSAVMPGFPMVRTTPAPAPLPEAVAAANNRRPSFHPERQMEGKAEMENVRLMLRDFQTRMGGNPVGSNAEIMRAVMGENEARARLGPPDGQSLNDQGELVDRWNRPYFFHQLSKTVMEIRSAGPDGVLWTTDDLIAK